MQTQCKDNNNMDLKKKDARLRTGVTRLKKGTVASSCKHSDEHSGSIKGRKFLD
jgi:hypothetical protein